MLSNGLFRCAIALLAATLLWAPAQASLVDQRVALFELLGASRPMEGRLSGGFPYRAYDAGAKAFDITKEKAIPRLARVEAELREQATEKGSPEASHLLGVFELLTGDADSAIEQLETALDNSGGAADVRNDLAVAYDYRAMADQDPTDILSALATLERAPESEEPTAEILFNRALLLERLGILFSAERAWKHFISEEKATEWSAEAERRLAQLPDMGRPAEDIGARLEALAAQPNPQVFSNAVKEATQQSRLLVEQTLLPAWARAMKDGETDKAGSTIAMAHRVSQELMSITFDPLLLEVVNHAETVAREPWNPRLDDLVTGFIAYGNALEALDRLDIVEARGGFDRALASLQRTGNPLMLWVRLQLAVCDNHGGRYEEAHSALSQLIGDATDRGYGALHARALWIKGHAFHAGSEPANALLCYREALAGFERLGEEEHAAWVSVLVAQSYDSLGQPESAWRYRYRALKALGRSAFRRRASGMLLGAADIASAEGFAEVALSMQNEALDIARREDSPIDEADVLWRRSLTRQRLGDTEGAAADLNRAFALLPMVEDASVHRLIESNLHMVKAELSFAAGAEQAVKPLTEALAALRSSNYRYYLLDMLRSRARAYVAGNDLDAAKADLFEGIAEAERQRESIRDRSQRLTLLDKEERLYDDLLDLLRDQGEIEESLTIAERARARGALDALAGAGVAAESAAGAKPLGAEEIRRHMPDDQVLVQYEAVGDRLLLWVVGRGSIELRSFLFDRDRIKRLIADLRESTVSGDAEEPVDEAAAELYTVLVEPIETLIQGARHLVFSPDDILNHVPFAALQNPRTHRYLIADYQISLTPSGSTYLTLNDSRPAETSERRKALLVANPTFDRRLFSRLPALPAAERIPAKLSGSKIELTVLKRQDATRRAFFEHLGTADVLYFAGHALVNAADPSLSQLLLAAAPEIDDSGVVYAREITPAALGRVRLVVLSACGSASGPLSASEGISSLASVFLSSGAENVIGGLWEVEDDEAAALFDSFFDYLLRGLEPAEALRRSQLDRSGTDGGAGKKTWAAFVHIGRLTGSQFRTPLVERSK